MFPQNSKILFVQAKPFSIFFSAVGGYSVLIQIPTTVKPDTIHIALLTIRQQSSYQLNGKQKKNKTFLEININDKHASLFYF